VNVQKDLMASALNDGNPVFYRAITGRQVLIPSHSVLVNEMQGMSWNLIDWLINLT
jgi:hypothetical protein